MHNLCIKYSGEFKVFQLDIEELNREITKKLDHVLTALANKTFTS